MADRESMPFDVVIVGGGPAGLSAAIRYATLAKENHQEPSICVLEKGAGIGAHSLAGAIIEPRALDELIPDWKDKNAPLNTPVSSDRFVYLTKNRAHQLPTPPQMHNTGNYVISLGLFTRWLAEQAEALGVDIFSGFAASELLYEGEKIIGVATAPSGIHKDGSHSNAYDPGMELHAKITLLAEGCRGSLSRQLIEKFNLQQNSQAQTYALGLKEIWEIPAEQHQAGACLHSIGWPLDSKTYGGGFAYQSQDNQINLGFVVGLDYANPYLSPFEEFQRFKTHPEIRKLLKNGKRIAYGARTMVEGGFQSIPKLGVKGALLIGDSAGFLNVPKIKGIHTAMKSGMLAAESVFESFASNDSHTAKRYQEKLDLSWLSKELQKERNIRPAFKKNIWLGLANAAFVTYLSRGKEPWTLGHHLDHKQTQPAEKHKAIDYPKPDNILSFDRLSSVYLSQTQHEENQVSHIKLKDTSLAIAHNFKLYASPELRYCPAQVFEITEDDQGEKNLTINAQNCLHCKCCDIKDPEQNIIWTPPEGGGGPLYANM